MASISWTSKKITAKESSISGKGVFAIQDIAAGERVAVFGGYTLSFEDLDSLEKTNPEEFETILDKGIQVDSDIIFSPTSESQFSDIEYLNHSCDPNTGFRGQLHLVAIKNIATGEEICMDYATCITNDIFGMDCDCGSDHCRGKVTGDDWKLAELQARYRGHFQPFIADLINQNK